MIRLDPLFLKSSAISSVGMAPCSIVSTPPRSASTTPSVLSTCAATGYPSLCASSQAARMIAGSIFSMPGSPSFSASMIPPVIISLMRSGCPSAILSTYCTASSGDVTGYASDPATCPPGTEIPALEVRILGPGAAALAAPPLSAAPSPDGAMDPSGILVRPVLAARSGFTLPPRIPAAFCAASALFAYPSSISSLTLPS